MTSVRPSCVAAAAVAVLGMLVLAGWALDIGALKSVLPGFASMKVNTALCFVLAGAALASVSSARAIASWTTRSSALVILAIALATLLQALLGVDFGIDQVMILDPEPLRHPGRMATATAVGFTAAGIALLLLTRGAASRRALTVLTASSVLVIGVGLLGLVGYALNFDVLYAWQAFSTVALHTAAGFVLLGTGLWCAGNRLRRVWAEEEHITPLALGLVIAATVATAVMSFAAAENGIAATLAAGMRTTLEARAAQVALGIESRTTTAASIANRPSMLRALQRLADDPAREDDRRTVQEALASYRPHGFQSLAIRSAQGDEIARVGAPVESPATQQRLRTANESVLLWRDGMYLRSHLPLGGPLGSLGTLITEQFLPVTTTGLRKSSRYVGETAELLLCSAESGGYGCFPSNRTREPFTLPPNSNGLGSLLEQAPGDQPAFGTVIDQRGRRVLAAAAPVGTYGPLAILKVDAEEIYRPIGIQIQFTAVLILAISIAGYLLMQRLVRPLAVGLEERVRARTAELAQANAELAQTNAELAESEQRFRLALESAPNGNLLIADDGRILFANARAKELLGYGGEELTRMRVEQLIPESLRGAHVAHRAAFAADPRSRPMGGGRDLYALRKDGTQLPVEIGLGPARIGGKTIVLASIVDITDRKRTEGELRRSNDALERSNIELQRFAYVASHDLQTPLRSIAGFTQLLQSEYAGRLDPQADDWIRRTVQSTKDMQTLVRDLLDYSRVDSQAGTFGPVPMQRVVDGAVALLDESIRDTGATVTHGALPVVTGDRSQLSQLMLNLIGNALKYRSDPPPRVQVAAERHNAEWLFSVRDNGIGIAPKHHERIFEMFRRLHDHKAIPGSGIGLAVCRRVVHRHGGRIWVQSEPGQGSTFFFTLPERTIETP